jgi:hypothetical protein
MAIETRRFIGQTVASLKRRALPIRGGDEMTSFLQAGMICCAALLLTTLLATPAAAKIQCRGNFQMTKYGPIATPYCEEEQIAFVARSYGQRVTGAQVRNDPLLKVYLCQTLGYDSRLKGSCAGYGPDSYAPAR